MIVKQLKNNNRHLTGACSGIFNPSEDAKYILDKSNYGSQFAYLFRRFGYPTGGWDDHKELVNYILTTSVKGLYLLVSPRPSECCTFGYRVTKRLDKKLWAESYSPVWDWWRAFKAQLPEPVWSYEFGEPTKKEWLAVVDNWNKTDLATDGDGGENELELFWKYQQDKFDQYFLKYKATSPKPHNDYSNEFHRDIFPEGSLRDVCNKALLATVHDLLRPVWVRDVPINLCGNVEDDFEMENADYYKRTGIGINDIVKSAVKKHAAKEIYIAEPEIKL